MCGIFFLKGVMTLAATRLIPMRKNKGKSIGACLHNHTSYIQNPDKTEQGELVSSYQCNPLTVDEEFLLTKRLYEQTTGRSQKSDVIGNLSSRVKLRQKKPTASVTSLPSAF